MYTSVLRRSPILNQLLSTKLIAKVRVFIFTLWLSVFQRKCHSVTVFYSSAYYDTIATLSTTVKTRAQTFNMEGFESSRNPRSSPQPSASESLSFKQSACYWWWWNRYNIFLCIVFFWLLVLHNIFRFHEITYCLSDDPPYQWAWKLLPLQRSLFNDHLWEG